MDMRYLRLCCADNVTKDVAFPENEPLRLDYLQSVCPGASGLEIKNPVPNASPNFTTVYLDPEKKFHLPDGIEDKSVHVIYKGSYRSASATPESSRAAKARPTPLFANSLYQFPKVADIEKFSLFIEENGIKSCVICLETYFFATFRHGTHKEYQIGKVVNVYDFDGKSSTEMTVRFIHEQLDYIILKSSLPASDVPILDKFIPGEDLIIIGRPNLDGIRCHSKGCIYSAELRNFSERGPDGYYSKGPFALATIHTEPGDSGGAIFGGGFSAAGRLLGMNLGIAKYKNEPIGDALMRAAHYKIINYFVQVSDLAHGVNIVRNEDSPPNYDLVGQPLCIQVDDVVYSGA